MLFEISSRFTFNKINSDTINFVLCYAAFVLQLLRTWTRIRAVTDYVTLNVYFLIQGNIQENDKSLLSW